MKYIINTFKYLKSNLLLLPALFVAMVAFAPIFDYSAFEQIATSFSDGHISSSFNVWLCFFLPVHTKNWLTVLLSVLGYVALIVDLAYIQSLTDKHVRFGSKSFRSMMSSLSVNFWYGLMLSVLLALVSSVNAFIFAAIMKTFAMFNTPYLFIGGIVICGLILFVELFVFCHFSLWLPCIEITGFKAYEALSYSYSLARPIRWRLFFTVTVPVIIVAAIWFVVTFTCTAWIATVISAAVCGFAFVLIITACYLAYVDREGIEREDLKRY
ncbi:MAG: hypothetical protein ACI4MH_01680 [Candidatus Coproplasma sp.]